MPFRRWFAQRGTDHPVAYSIALLAGGMFVSMLVAVFISVAASNRALRESEQRSCAALRAELEAYTETPPTTAAGRNIMRAKLEQYRVQRCPEGANP